MTLSSSPGTILGTLPATFPQGNNTWQRPTCPKQVGGASKHSTWANVTVYPKMGLSNRREAPETPQ
jgi:hypothetical protein